MGYVNKSVRNHRGIIVYARGPAGASILYQIEEDSRTLTSGKALPRGKAGALFFSALGHTSKYYEKL